MNGVTFDGMHSYEKFGLILMSVTNPNPVPKTYQVEVPGADGVLDYTDAFGATRFNQRKLNMKFAFDHGYWKRYTTNSEVANALHGKKMKIILDEDPGFYYLGRVNMDEWKPDKSLGILSFEIIADPYKYELLSSLDKWKWDTFHFPTGIIRNYKDIMVDREKTVKVIGRKKEIVPRIISDSKMEVEWKGIRYPVPKGETKIYAISIPEGENYLTFYGNGVVSIEYRGGIL